MGVIRIPLLRKNFEGKLMAGPQVGDLILIQVYAHWKRILRIPSGWTQVQKETLLDGRSCVTLSRIANGCEGETCEILTKGRPPKWVATVSYGWHIEGGSDGKA